MYSLHVVNLCTVVMSTLVCCGGWWGRFNVVYLLLLDDDMTMHGDMMMLGVWCANGVRMLCEECAKNIIHVEACVGMYVGMLASPV